MELKKEEIIQYIKHFDSIFNTDILNDFDMNKLILFFSIHEKLKEDLCTPTEEYLKVQNEKSKIYYSNEGNLIISVYDENTKSYYDIELFR